MRYVSTHSQRRQVRLPPRCPARSGSVGREERPPWRRRGGSGAPRSGAREAAARGGRGRLVEAQERLLHRVVVGALLLGLELGEALGRQLARVLLLDPLQPLGARGLLGGVDLDVLGRRVLVDLLEQLVDELLLGHLLERLAAREDETLVLGARDAEVGVRRL